MSSKELQPSIHRVDLAAAVLNARLLRDTQVFVVLLRICFLLQQHLTLPAARSNTIPFTHRKHTATAYSSPVSFLVTCILRSWLLPL